MPTPTNASGLRDNHTRGTVADFLRLTADSPDLLAIIKQEGKV